MGKSLSIDSSSWFYAGVKGFKAATGFIPWLSLVFICFSNALPRIEYVKLACFVILLSPDGKISSSVRNSYWSILLDNNTDIPAASLLISYCNFSPLV